MTRKKYVKWSLFLQGWVEQSFRIENTETFSFLQQHEQNRSNNKTIKVHVEILEVTIKDSTKKKNERYFGLGDWPDNWWILREVWNMYEGQSHVFVNEIHCFKFF